MTSPTSGRRRGYAASAAVAVLLLTGCANSTPAQTVVAPERVKGASAAPAPATPEEATATSQSATETKAASPSPRNTASASPLATQSPHKTAPAPSPAPPPPDVMAASAPVSIHIPSTGTQSELLSLGLREDGSLDVPPEGPGAPAAWYNRSPTPGERGPAVLLGHVNATGGGPGVFANLRALQPGDLIRITRQDGTTAVFAFHRAEQYPKDAFPTLTVYGNTEGAELRLITCDGYDPATGQFDDNYVVYAKLVP